MRTPQVDIDLPPHSHKIVGAFYRQRDGVCPAKALLTVLPSGTPLIVRPDPDNEVDPNAIAVWIATAEVENNDDVISVLADCGWNYEQLIEESERPLGFIPAVDAAKLHLDSDIEGRFTFNIKGEPAVTWR